MVSVWSLVSLWPHSGRTARNRKVSGKRGTTGKSHGKAIFYVLPKELSHTTCTFLNIILAWSRKSRFCWAKQRNRQSRMLWITELPRNTIGVGWLFSGFRLVGFKAVTVQLLKQVVLMSFSQSVSYLLSHLQFSHISRLILRERIKVSWMVLAPLFERLSVHHNWTLCFLILPLRET